MDIHTVSEESYKRGFERGYTEGVCDRAAELLDGAIRWHRKKPERDHPHCLAVYRTDNGCAVSAASYMELCDAFLVPRKGVLKREEVILWGEIRTVAIEEPKTE